MSRIESRFNQLRESGRAALVPYITAGDPEPGATVPLMHALVEAGADVLELGVPFSDPQADGPVIQNACERALAHQVTLSDVLAMVAEFRQRDGDTPVVLMGYLNPIESMGGQAFAGRAGEVGVDGVLVVDAPPEEDEELVAALSAHGIDPIFLLAPTTPEERMERICHSARGFVYYVSLKGVTGAASLAVDEVESKLQAIRRHTALPVGVGFGIRDAESAARIGAFADAVVVGSAVVARVAEHSDDLEAGRAAVSELVGDMRAALDAARDADRGRAAGG
ncbi:MAG: tryptophan synthase subunit alpha [Halofilum sp. (in: g-proteobacteria)]|nr:tryptophan synthase subunit alpha [Halofilum sp. (in: g-proteobacteria)]